VTSRKSLSITLAQHADYVRYRTSERAVEEQAAAMRAVELGAEIVTAGEDRHARVEQRPAGSRPLPLRSSKIAPS